MKLIVLSILLTDFILNSFIIQDQLPGNTTLVSSKQDLIKLASFEKESYKYTVEDYSQRPKQNSFKFSPNGLYLSYQEKDETGICCTRCE